jgi:hypothetical protein
MAARNRLISGIALGLGIWLAQLGAAYATVNLPAIGEATPALRGRLNRYSLVTLGLACLIIFGVFASRRYRPEWSGKYLFSLVLGLVIAAPVAAFVGVPAVTLLSNAL